MSQCGPPAFIGQGGTIPLMNMLARGFPKAQMMVCGVLGPKSNAHGPNEFLHVPYAKRLTAAVAQVVLNRVRNPAYPDTVCGVVYQNDAGGFFSSTVAVGSPLTSSTMSSDRAVSVAE